MSSCNPKCWVLRILKKKKETDRSNTTAQFTQASAVDVSEHVPFDPRNGMMVNWRESTQMFFMGLAALSY